MDEIKMKKLLFDYKVFDLEIKNELPKNPNYSYYKTIIYLFDSFLE